MVSPTIDAERELTNSKIQLLWCISFLLSSPILRVSLPSLRKREILIIRVRTSSSLAIVCMNDISSSTGYILNGKHFPPGATYRLGDKRVGSRMIVLRDGDEIQVPGTPQGAFLTVKSGQSRLLRLGRPVC